MWSVESILSNQIRSHRSPSVQYYLFNKNEIIKECRIGLTDMHHQKPIDAHTTYHAFSVTKTFTALAVLQLAEQGKLDVEQPVAGYLPEFAYGTNITTRQILNHTAGIPNPIPISWIHLKSEHEAFKWKDFFNKIFAANKKLRSAPGAKFSYSNLGYVILGQLIEKISGRSYKAYITENVINKLSLSEDDLGFEITNDTGLATGYHRTMSFSGLLLGFFINRSKFTNKAEGKWRSFKSFYVNGVSYGGLIGKPLAFVKYIQEFLKDESPLLSNEYKKLLFEEAVDHNNKKTGMCLSWFTGELEGNKYFTHADGGGGYYCEIRIYPVLGIGSVIFFNRTGMKDERFLDRPDKEYISKGRL